MEGIGVYILQCANGRFYTGSTNEIERRLWQHQSGQVKATSNILPVHLRKFISCADLKSARKLEYRIKKMKSRKYIEKLINENAE